jgi:hypothetical protein
MFLSKGCQVLHDCSCDPFWFTNLFPDMVRRSRNLMALDQGCASSHFCFCTQSRMLSQLKWEIMFQQLIVLVSRLTARCKYWRAPQYLLLLIIVLVGEIHTARGLHNPRTWLPFFFFFLVGEWGCFQVMEFLFYFGVNS